MGRRGVLWGGNPPWGGPRRPPPRLTFWHTEAADTRVRRGHCRDNLRRRVGAPVIDDGDVETIGRVVERGERPDRLRDDARLVAGRDDDRDTRPVVRGRSGGTARESPAVYQSGDKQRELISDHEPDEDRARDEPEVQPGSRQRRHQRPFRRGFDAVPACSARMTRTMRSAARPSPKTLATRRRRRGSSSFSTVDTIRRTLVPASRAAPACTASMRSVVSRMITTGTPRAGASSWMPPETVMATDR